MLHAVRNHLGMELEKLDRVDEAIVYYEANIAEGNEGNGPYDRLAILYRKRKEYGHEVRVLQTAISRFDELSKSSPRADVAPKLVKFKARLEKAEAFRAKASQAVPDRPSVEAPHVSQDRIDAYQRWIRDGGRRDVPIWTDLSDTPRSVTPSTTATQAATSEPEQLVPAPVAKRGIWARIAGR